MARGLDSAFASAYRSVIPSSVMRSFGVARVQLSTGMSEAGRSARRHTIERSYAVRIDSRPNTVQRASHISGISNRISPLDELRTDAKAMSTRMIVGSSMLEPDDD
jgi:hypothetical protein